MRNSTQKRLIEIGKAKKNARLVKEQASQIRNLQATVIQQEKEIIDLKRELSSKELAIGDLLEIKKENKKKIEAQKKAIKLWIGKAQKAEEELKECKERLKYRTIQLRKKTDRANIMFNAKNEIIDDLKNKLETKTQRIKTLSARIVKAKREIKRLKGRSFWKRLLNK